MVSEQRSDLAWYVKQPVAWGAALMAVAVLIVVTVRSADDPGQSFGVSLIVGGLALIVMSIASRWWVTAPIGIAVIASGALVVARPAEYVDMVGFAGGVAAAIVGVALLLGYRRRRMRPGIRYLAGAVSVAGGILLMIFEGDIVWLSTGGTGLVLTALLVSGLIEARRQGQAGAMTVGQVTGLALHWLRSRVDWADDPAAIHEKLLFEGKEAGRRIVRFYVLMGFASAIASFGVVTDSTAVVIGAMLIAPLLTPLMAISLSLVMGWTRRLLRSLAVAGGGALMSVLIGVLVSAIAGVATDVGVNSQIVSRTTPTLLDLFIAIAAGAAGAYALSRHDVSDSLPGVAVAIALVPPLAVAGVALQLAEWRAASGALLLFLTNAVAIFGMGALTFVLTGAADIRRYEAARHGLRSWILGLVGVGVLVLGALLANGANLTLAGFREDRASAAVADWIGDRPLEVSSILIEDGRVIVSLAGVEMPHDPEALAAALAESFQESVVVDVRLTLQEHVEVTAP